NICSSTGAASMTSPLPGAEIASGAMISSVALGSPSWVSEAAMATSNFSTVGGGDSCGTSSSFFTSGGKNYTVSTFGCSTGGGVGGGGVLFSSMGGGGQPMIFGSIIAPSFFSI